MCMISMQVVPLHLLPFLALILIVVLALALILPLLPLSPWPLVCRSNGTMWVLMLVCPGPHPGLTIAVAVATLTLGHAKVMEQYTWLHLSPSPLSSFMQN